MKYLLSFLFCSSLFLLSPNHIFAQGGDNAASALGAPITLPFSAAGTTCGHVDNYNPFSPYGLTSGKDWLYYFCAPSSGPVDIFITSAYGIAPGIMVYSVTPNAGGSNWFATSFTGGGLINSLVTVTVTAGTCYYVMIDNAPQYADGAVSCFNYTATIRYHTNPPAAPLEPACSNIGYDNGNTTGWVGTTGIVTTGATGAATPLYTPLYYSTSATQHSVTSGGGVDLYGSFPIVNPAGGSNSLRLGDVGTYGNTNQYSGGIPGAQGATMEQKFTVTPSNALFVYYYAVVIQNALSDSTDALGNVVNDASGNPILIPHKAVEQPYFKTDIYDCTGTPVVCGQYLVTGGPNIPGFNLAPGTTDVYYKTWSPVAVDLTPFIGTCVTVRYTVGDCTIGGHFAYAYVDAICQPLAITGVNIVCPTKSTVLTAPVGLFTYSWTPGGLSTQSVAVTPTTTTTYTCELTSYTNCKTFLTYSVSLYPQEIASANSATICNGVAAAISATTSLAGGTYSWSPAAPASGNISVSPATTTSYICTYTDPNGCQDTAMARVTVNPIPTLTTPTNIAVCHNTSVGASAFTSTVAGTTFSWTNSNTSTGLTANGAGNTPVFTAVNAGSSPISSIVSVTPTANSCVGPPVSYTITVNPIPTVNAVPSATYCSGIAVPANTFTGSVTGATYNWNNTNTTIGAPASGANTVAGFTAANAGAAPISGVITVTPTANTCIGIPTNYTIAVNPIPTVNAVPSATYCNGITVPANTFTGSVTATTFNWVNSNTTIGASASGVNTVAGFNATNVGAAPISGVITVTPTANTCTGTPTSYTIVVNPIPTVNAVPSATYCSGIAVPANTFTGSVTATTFNWVNSNTTIGAPASGVNTVAGFTAANAGAAPISGVITVTPTANTCTGTPTSYTIAVNPIPTVNAVPSATYCSGIAVPANTFTGSVTATTFNWVNSNTTIGAPPSGINTVAGFNATNAGASMISGVITVTPTANTCTGTPTSYTIAVNPIPTVTVPTSATYCSGLTVPVSTFSSNLATTIYNWSNSNSTIGLGASGIGNAPSFTSSNSGTTSIVGAITVTPSASGCIGTPMNFSITVYPVPIAPSAADATICPGSSATLTATAPGGTYAWYDAQVAGNLLITNATYNTPVLNTTTTYYVNTTNASGCVSPFTPVTANVLNFLTVTASPNQTICVGVTANLNGTPNGAGYTYSWDSPGSPAFSTIINPTVTPVATTIYTVTITSPNGCTGSSQTKVTVNPLPIPNPGNSIAFCAGQSGTLGGPSTAGYSYAWLATTGLSSSTISNPTVTLPNTGTTPIVSTYSLTVTLNGCQASNTVQVTVNPLPISNAGAPITLCAGQTGAIGTANTVGYAYSWSPTSFLSNSSASNPTVTGVNGGTAPVTTTYVVTTTESSTSCQSNAQVLVKVLPLPTVNAGSAIPVCAGTNNIPLSGVIGGSANSSIWSGGAGSYSPSSSALNASYHPTASEFTSGSVTLSLTAIATAPCQNVSSSVVVNFYPNPVISFTVDNPKGCPVHCVNFTDQSTITAPDNIQAWSWDFGDGGTSSVQNPAHCYNNTGLYSVTLTATSNHLCSTTMSIPQMIEVYPVPIASFIPNPLVTTIVDPTIYFQNTSQGATSYSWNFGDAYCGSIAANTSTLTSPTHTYSVAQDYIVDLIATSIHGCVSEATVTVKVEPEFTFYIPNAFTPGSTDGVNDIFTGMGIGIVTYEMWIFDRWGVNIYYTDDLHKGWDGTVQGKPGLVQQDVYTWKVKLKDVFNRNHDYVGHVTVLR
jgi:gliding motility-associated-like protein